MPFSVSKRRRGWDPWAECRRQQTDSRSGRGRQRAGDGWGHAGLPATRLTCPPPGSPARRPAYLGIHAAGESLFTVSHFEKLFRVNQLGLYIW